MAVTTASRDVSPRAVSRKLDALNFFLADVRDGLGPYLAIYLLTVQHWDEASIGIVMSIGGLAGILAQTPAGAIVDATGHKRTLLVVAAAAVTLGSIVLPWTTSFSAVAIANAVTGAAGSLFAPALAAMTLGIVGHKAFARRIGRNEAFNHAGNATAAGIAAVTAYFFGPVVVFWLMAALAIASIFHDARHSRRCRGRQSRTPTSQNGLSESGYSIPRSARMANATREDWLAAPRVGTVSHEQYAGWRPASRHKATVHRALRRCCRCHRHHHRLRCNDADGHQAGAEILIYQRQLLADQRQHRRVGEMEQRRCCRKHQQGP